MSIRCWFLVVNVPLSDSGFINCIADWFVAQRRSILNSNRIYLGFSFSFYCVSATHLRHNRTMKLYWWPKTDWAKSWDVIESAGHVECVPSSNELFELTIVHFYLIYIIFVGDWVDTPLGQLNASSIRLSLVCYEAHPHQRAFWADPSPSRAIKI